MTAIREERARLRVLDNAEALGLSGHLLELETQGFTVLKSALTPAQVERAKTSILSRVEAATGCAIDPQASGADEFRGMQYQHYLIFDDPVFQEILLMEKPLALMHYLLGESCVLSSMGSHFRGPGGLPRVRARPPAGAGSGGSPLSPPARYRPHPGSREALGASARPPPAPGWRGPQAPGARRQHLSAHLLELL